MHLPDVRPALKLIARVPYGRKLVEGFLPLLERGQAVVRQMDDEAAVSLSATLGGSRKADYGRPAGGFVYDGSLRTIYLESTPLTGSGALPETDLRLQAPLLVHEMIHCLDERYLASRTQEVALYEEFKRLAVNALTSLADELRLAPETITLSQVPEAPRAEIVSARRRAQAFSDARLFQAERVAYSGLYRWTEEICERLPGYRTFLAAARAQGYVFDRPVSDDEIIRIYGINPEAVSKR